VETSFEIEHDLLVDTLAVEIFTAGAGGGSLVYLDELGDLQVGPESAGSVPGPVCYGRGGEQPSITDVYLLNNILQEDEFLGGDMTLHSDLAEEALMDLDLDMDLEDRLEYAQRVGREHLLNGLERVAVERAIDPREYSLLAYGAAGPMIIPEILDDVGVREIIIPPAPGEFSAMGLLSTDLIYSETTTEYIPLEPDSADEISAIFRDLEEGIFDSVDVDEDAGDLVVERFFDGRVQGQTWDTPLISAPAGDLDDADIERMVENFHAEYERKWNNRFESYPVTATTYRVRVTQPMPKIEHTEIERADGEAPQHGTTEVIKQETLEYGEYRRDELQWGHEIKGPAIVRQPTATIQICDGQRAEVGQYGEITITRSE
jgi:N-methylhydantoinase A